jgi:hypothetical protein
MSPSREKSLETRSEALTTAVHPTVEEIEARAYQIYTERGGADGHDMDDWLQAERELFAKYQRTERMAKKAVAE